MCSSWLPPGKPSLSHVHLQFCLLKDPTLILVRCPSDTESDACSEGPQAGNSKPTGFLQPPPPHPALVTALAGFQQLLLCIPQCPSLFFCSNSLFSNLWAPSPARCLSWFSYWDSALVVGERKDGGRWGGGLCLTDLWWRGRRAPCVLWCEQKEASRFQGCRCKQRLTTVIASTETQI